MTTETPQPLTDDEVAELDSYGRITGRTPLPKRALDLWTREIYWGRETPDPNACRGLAGLIDGI